jgi:hypothetical protein
MLYFAVPRLSLSSNGAQQTFSFVWLTFALMVIAGNLTGLLYHPRKQVQQTGRLKKQQLGKKKRSFH